MRKVAIVFLLSIIAPSLVLAALAWRSLRDQQFVLERQQALLFQGACDSNAAQIRDQMRAQESAFIHAVDTVLEDHDPRTIAPNFNPLLRKAWPEAEIGFAVTLDGNLLAPHLFEDDPSSKFRRDYELFLSNRAAAEVYPSQWASALNNGAPSPQQLQSSPSLALISPASPSERLNGKAEAAGAASRQVPAMNEDQAQQMKRVISKKELTLSQSTPPIRPIPNNDLPSAQNNGPSLDSNSPTPEPFLAVSAPVVPSASAVQRFSSERAAPKPKSQPVSPVPATTALQPNGSASVASKQRHPDLHTTIATKQDLFTASNARPNAQLGALPPSTTPNNTSGMSNSKSLKREPLVENASPQTNAMAPGRAKAAEPATNPLPSLPTAPTLNSSSTSSQPSDSSALDKDINRATLKRSVPASALEEDDVSKQHESIRSLDTQNKGNNSFSNIYSKTAKVIQRKVTPLKDREESPPPISRFAPAEAEFRQLIGGESSGALALFMQNRLSLLVWYRSPRDPQLVFGAKLLMPEVVNTVAQNLAVDNELREQICIAVIDDTGKAIARTHPGFTAPSWKRPFVATEIGEALPHWEVAAYLLDPAELNRAASSLHVTVASLIAVMLLAIAVGGWLIVLDLRRQLVIARQKTDFVSNVSHELKTPLTSIRMFSELLQDRRADDPAKRRHFAHIISSEAARLTRLINNVLDFARLERGEMSYQFQPCDLALLTQDLLAGYTAHLEAAGFTFELALMPPLQQPLHWQKHANELSDNCKEVTPLEGTRSNGTYISSNPEASLESKSIATSNPIQNGAMTVPIVGDIDALTQVVLNLISNAEKYGGSAKSIRIEIATEPTEQGSSTSKALVRVLDRGAGVAAGCEHSIFDQFFRAHNALNSGIQGSGLGLTLSRKIARAHGGDVTYQPRAGGGSVFTLSLPLQSQKM